MAVIYTADFNAVNGISSVIDEILVLQAYVFFFIFVIDNRNRNRNR